MCIAVSALPKEDTADVTWSTVLVILFASAGKASASAAFNSGYVLTSKIYPTNVRNTLTSLVLCI